MNGQPYAPPRRGDGLTWWKVATFLAAVPFLLARWAVKHWPIVTPAVLVVWVWATVGTLALIITTAVITAGLLAWRLGHPASFARFVAVPFARWRRRLTYRRVWTATMHNAGLTRGFGPERVAPRIVRMRLRGPTDRLLIQLLAGQGIDELRNAVDALGDTFDALRVTILPEGHGHGSTRQAGRVWVHLTLTDHLEQTIAPIPAPDTGAEVDLSRLPIGVREDGTPWTVSATGGSHLLIGGATNAGKSSILWALIHALGPGIRDGLVQVWACDPKGGMELGLGQPLFTRFAHGRTDGDMVTLLEDVEGLIVTRAAAYMGTTRRHIPTVDEPHVIVVLDELAGLTAYQPDRDISKRLDRVLPRVLSQGRSVGVTVVGATQDARKRAIDMRSLFPTRIALRTAESDDVAVILTDGAHARGARCEHIPYDTPGVGYVEAVDHPDTPIRVRAAYHDDNAILDLVAQYRPRPRLARVGDLVQGEIITTTGGSTDGNTDESRDAA